MVLATGHSSRALFEQLSNDGVLLEFQSFASGFRIEHPQELLNELQYGERFAKRSRTRERAPSRRRLQSRAHEQRGQSRRVFVLYVIPEVKSFRRRQMCTSYALTACHSVAPSVALGEFWVSHERQVGRLRAVQRRTRNEAAF